ncbi:MAG: hypothetical protein P0Y49_13990 [Candidatus Pedobacter colombiensis]|uniref:Uncharacterized protein n=1 Tax=Candidatus Pedobacter colombiensis TaxID=3121371 RepID=A0AAJ5W6J2_9SPHI|nr:hypothetical protein [Pedobacter sp.]WEK17909.1 MAG: hypothetical protein P0Y49_13990 [Pedobacter sp.]
MITIKKLPGTFWAPDTSSISTPTLFKGMFTAQKHKELLTKTKTCIKAQPGLGSGRRILHILLINKSPFVLPVYLLVCSLKPAKSNPFELTPGNQ